jgi:predicted HTH domain antitoxin
MLAVEGYRSGELSRGQVSELLGIGFDETEAFLKKHGADLGLTAGELEQDSANLRQFLAR